MTCPVCVPPPACGNQKSRPSAAVSAPGNQAAAEKPAWEAPLAVNGLSEESELTVIDRAEFDRLTAGADVRLVKTGEAINLSGGATSWQNSWWWLLLGVLTLLIAEMLVLVKP